MSRKLKKIAALVLAAAMLLSCFAVNSFAAGGETMNVGLALSAESAKAGDEITVTVSISNNYNAVTMRFPILYSKEVFELVEDSLTADINSVTAVAGSTTYTTNEEFIPASYSAETYSAFAIQWIATSDGTTIGAFKSETAVTCFTFKLKVLEDAEGTGSVFIPSDSDKFYKTAVSDTADALSTYIADVAFTISEAESLTVEAAYTAPELVVADGATTVIDRENGFIYGLIDGDSEYGEIDESNIGDWLAVVGEGEIEIVGVDGLENVGTGAEINLLNADGEVVESYKAVIFGDFDGDGYITDFDLTEFSFYCAMLEDEVVTDYTDMTLPQVFAMDVDQSGEPDDFDLPILQYAAAWISNDIDQTYGM